jgi:Cd2+/Zn2+-exporting ATPase
MNKTRINLDIVLPDIPNEKDDCVQRIIKTMTEKRGIEKVHVIPETDTSKAQLCFHYNTEEISLEQIQKLAEKAGAEITERYGHLLLEVKGIRHVRNARVIELSLKDTKGIMSVLASAAGWINVEFDHHEITSQKIFSKLNKLGLTVVSPALKSIPVHKHVHKGEEKHDEHKEAEHKHDEHDHAAHDHEHSHGGIFGEKTELIFASICGALLGIGFGLSFIKGLSEYASIGFYIGAYLFGGFYTTKEAIEGISKGEFEIDFLMLVAAIGAACLGQWAEGALLLFLFSLRTFIRTLCYGEGKKSIAALADLAPKTALLKNG